MPMILCWGDRMKRAILVLCLILLASTVHAAEDNLEKRKLKSSMKEVYTVLKDTGLETVVCQSPDGFICP